LPSWEETTILISEAGNVHHFEKTNLNIVLLKNLGIFGEKMLKEDQIRFRKMQKEHYPADGKSGSKGLKIKRVRTGGCLKGFPRG